jgi:CDGSH-type Zn-finger protein
LVVWDKKTKKAIENKFEPSIDILEDPQAKMSGPIGLRGDIQLEGADGTKYEKRNRITLCRCGRSKNKPFCDSSHIDFGFNDRDKNLR